MNPNEEKDAPFLGIVLDTRPEEKKQIEDVQFNEVVASANPVVWAEKAIPQIRKFPIFNQNGSGSCVAQTGAKMAGIMYWLKNGKKDYVHFSATHIYIRRNNKPAPGMAGENVFDILQRGVTLEQLVPSEDLSDQQMDNTVIEKYKEDVGSVFKFGKPINLPSGDIETVASTISTTGKGIMVWFYFTIDEWTTFPTIKNPNLNCFALSTIRHSVTAVDFTLLGPSNAPDKPELWGKKALVIDDSWGSSFGAAGQRFITEDFFKARNWYTRHVQNFKFNELDETGPVNNLLRYNFNKNLQFIPWDTTTNAPKDIALNSEQKLHVMFLQDILKAEGFLANNIATTGYYGALTAEAVLKLQKNYMVAPLEDLLELGGKNVGPNTRAFLNQKYGV